MILDMPIIIATEISSRRDLQYQTFFSIHFDYAVIVNRVFFQLTKYKPNFDGSIEKIIHTCSIKISIFDENISAELFEAVEWNLNYSMNRANSTLDILGKKSYY